VGLKVEVELEIEYPEDYGNKVSDYLIYSKDGRVLEQVDNPT